MAKIKLEYLWLDGYKPTQNLRSKTKVPLGFPIGGYPGPQGMYYCSVGGKNTFGRDFVEEHANLCIDAGLNFEGINQEVASGRFVKLSVLLQKNILKFTVRLTTNV